MKPNAIEQLPLDLEYIPILTDQRDAFRHILDEDMKNAVNAALAVNRPLLVWGEPGIGKSQLARAVAAHLKRPFHSFVADAQTRSHDLMWRFDAVGRLAEAQLQRAAPPPRQHEAKKGQAEKSGLPVQEAGYKDPMEIRNFMAPGVLWWAFDPASARTLAERCGYQESVASSPVDEGKGAVVLIDEIDKADPDVPNGLLEALGAGRFHPQGLEETVVCGECPPLVLITTNEERALPDAFLRRCLALHLAFPQKEQEQIDWLVKRALGNAKAFGGLGEAEFRTVAGLLVEDRLCAKRNHLYPLPGQAEFFDLLRGMQRQIESGQGTADELMGRMRKFTFQKNPGFHRDANE